VIPDHAPLVLPASLDAPATARLHLRTYAPQLSPAMFGDVLIMMNELVTNAVQHGQPPVTLQVDIDPGGVTVTVGDTSAAVPPAIVRAPSLSSTSGRGLLIVEELSTRWGVSPRHNKPGKNVWFQLEIAEADYPPPA
jgi:anti-sigma regulatory factor (Ser/Thr protein kinase)